MLHPNALSPILASILSSLNNFVAPGHPTGNYTGNSTQILLQGPLTHTKAVLLRAWFFYHIVKPLLNVYVVILHQT